MLLWTAWLEAEHADSSVRLGLITTGADEAATKVAYYRSTLSLLLRLEASGLDNLRPPVDVVLDQP